MQGPDLLPLLSLICRDVSGVGERLSLSLVPESLLVAAWPGLALVGQEAPPWMFETRCMPPGSSSVPVLVPAALS